MGALMETRSRAEELFSDWVQLFGMLHAPSLERHVFDRPDRLQYVASKRNTYIARRSTHRCPP